MKPLSSTRAAIFCLLELADEAWAKMGARAIDADVQSIYMVVATIGPSAACLELLKPDWEWAITNYELEVKA